MNKTLQAIVTAVLGDQWRKYAMWILGSSVVIGQTDMGLSNLQLMCLTAITAAALIGQGIADMGKGALLAADNGDAKSPE